MEFNSAIIPTTEIENFHKNIGLAISVLKIPIELFRPIFKNNLLEAQEKKRIKLAGYIHSLFLSSQSDEQLKLLKLETEKQPFLLDFIFRTTKTKFQKENKERKGNHPNKTTKIFMQY